MEYGNPTAMPSPCLLARPGRPLHGWGTPLRCFHRPGLGCFEPYSGPFLLPEAAHSHTRIHMSDFLLFMGSLCFGSWWFETVNPCCRQGYRMKVQKQHQSNQRCFHLRVPQRQSALDANGMSRCLPAHVWLCEGNPHETLCHLVSSSSSSTGKSDACKKPVPFLTYLMKLSSSAAQSQSKQTQEAHKTLPMAWKITMTRLRKAQFLFFLLVLGPR